MLHVLVVGPHRASHYDRPKHYRLEPKDKKYCCFDKRLDKFHKLALTPSLYVWVIFSFPKQQQRRE